MKNENLYLNIEFLKKIDLLEYIQINFPTVNLFAPVDTYKTECDDDSLIDNLVKKKRSYTTTITQGYFNLTIPYYHWTAILLTQSELRNKKIKFLLNEK